MFITHKGERLKVVRWNGCSNNILGGEVIVEIPKDQRWSYYSRCPIAFTDLKKVQVTLIKKWPAWVGITLT